MRRTADDLAAALKGMPESIVAKRPAENAWAGKEVVCHLRNTEESFVGRFLTILANDEPKFLPIDPDDRRH
ncbi:MAG: DinB family protein [Candidatus Rokubacteria bacterium]|nr:DinB family protein [Candidatus Rokubacteria bacterium]MBI2544591.1 DinB family protein [Candidatus Rokubacteria bacterium]